jgi:tetratricopeptide (TPR) repeat protein
MRVRFGKWQEILSLPKLNPQWQYAVGIEHFARGVAELQLGQIAKAQENLKALQAIIRQGANDAMLGKFGIGLLDIAHYLLKGLITYHAHDKNQATQTLQALHDFTKAVQLQDTFVSADPPSWFFPTRQLLGFFFLKNHQFQKARLVFLEDLKKHPHNGWSLYGLVESLRHLGKMKEAQRYQKEFKEAWKYADIALPFSLLDKPRQQSDFKVLLAKSWVMT